MKYKQLKKQDTEITLFFFNTPNIINYINKIDIEQTLVLWFPVGKIKYFGGKYTILETIIYK